MSRSDASSGKEKPRQTRDAAATRARILKAAEKEFAKKGLKGTRIDAIATRARCNKALIYHYFGSKEDLFSAVLEVTYEKIRAAERKLDLAHRSPRAAMQELIGFSFDYVSDHPEFISLINDENMHGGVHVLHSARARDLNSPLVALIEEILKRGEAEGVFRSGVDPVQLYISIASICYFFIANRHTLSAIFALPKTRDVLDMRRRHVVDVILGYLRPDASSIDIPRVQP
ncbi:TetR/AcrR family transcriptional regulator [Aquamicrobium sp. LC103]|uniref:TetR/AcrR family transcriptional regulator n=1 Tax=Aquamicrobium sp. LC103 TaxID=1120658 RepID=UPI00063ED295|nr:TetR/AcrR family transcriptional regulator [Aquamicrobium sp. LC103]TKT78328.1 TetR/AcrR family transcriptional regulator [Aquamicrobium sp. LC103]